MVEFMGIMLAAPQAAGHREDPWNYP